MATPSNYHYLTAVREFQRAHQQAALQTVIGSLTGRATRLLSYDEVARSLKLAGRSDRGLRQIPVQAIVGSVGRYTDFTRTFLPRQKTDEQRWARVKTAMDQGNMPPIDVYKVGEVYFVLDGNHRVSIARQNGMESMDAHVIEIQSPVPITPDIKPDDLIIKAEYAEFLERTHLDRLRPNVDISLTAPGQYRRLLERIDVECNPSGCTDDPQAAEQAALCWYDEVYLPMLEVIREQGLLRWFPDRTEADLVLWVSDHRAALENELGWAVRPEAAVDDLAVRESSRAQLQADRLGAWRQSKMVDRYISENLFKQILVPLNGTEECWGALEQALMIAAREDARLHALHVIPSEADRDLDVIRALESKLAESCRKASITWDFHVDVGDTAACICERARLADLVALNVTHPPQAGLSSLSSGLRSIIWKCPRPILTTCCNVTPLNRVVLAFDGSPKSKEALFVAAYLAEQWLSSLTVVTITESKRSTHTALDYARSYLELHEIQAHYLERTGPAQKTLHSLLDEQEANLLIMGGYSGTVINEVMVGSLVNAMLRINHCPIIICR